MSTWVFLLWMALGIGLAVLLTRYLPLRRPARARLQLRRKRLRYLQPYAPTPAPGPAPAASEKGPACD